MLFYILICVWFVFLIRWDSCESFSWVSVRDVASLNGNNLKCRRKHARNTCFCFLFFFWGFLQCLLIHEQGTSQPLHTFTRSVTYTHWLTRLWRQAGVWSRKPSGWRKWWSPPSSLPLTLLLNITKAYLRKAQHKVRSCRGFNKVLPVRISEIWFFFSPTGLASSVALKAAFL